MTFSGFAFPEDFFRFREFLAGLPTGILGDVCDMHPGFPFDIADGKPATTHPGHPFWEGRCYNDLPEFVSVFYGTTDGLHFGYFFDAPGELPPVVASYWHSDTFQHSIMGDGFFEATRWYVEKAECDFQDMAEYYPEDAEDAREGLEKVDILRTALVGHPGGDREETGSDYLDTYGDSNWRKPVDDTWDGLGIVVAEASYRPLSADPFVGHSVNLQRPQIAGLIAEARRMLDAGQPGAALKLGRDLWVWANDYPECYALLDAAYAALGREPLRRLLAEARAWRQHCDATRRRRPVAPTPLPECGDLPTIDGIR